MTDMRIFALLIALVGAVKLATLLWALYTRKAPVYRLKKLTREQQKEFGWRNRLKYKKRSGWFLQRRVFVDRDQHPGQYWSRIISLSVATLILWIIALALFLFL